MFETISSHPIYENSAVYLSGQGMTTFFASFSTLDPRISVICSYIYLFVQIGSEGVS